MAGDWLKSNAPIDTNRFSILSFDFLGGMERAMDLEQQRKRALN